MILKPYTLRLDRCDFEKNEAGCSCRRGCGNTLEEPLAEGTFFSCGKGREITGGYLFWCPGCKAPHPYRVARAPWEKPDVPVWDFDGNLACPTFSPSLLVFESNSNPRCHLFVTNGELRYCTDCGHELAGKIVPMTKFPDEW